MFFLAGCASFAKGVTEAILERPKEERELACHIEGPPSQGLETLLREQEADRASGKTSRQLKVSMVHGIGHHVPGYSGRLTENLMRELKLQVKSERSKEIALRDPKFGDRKLGVLQIDRYVNRARTRELLFYEVTWAEIAEPVKKVLEFDSSGEQTFRRTAFNNYLKQFFNSTVPDALVYMGETQGPILASLRQTLCWMTVGDWEDYPDAAEQSCDLKNPGRAKHVVEDDVAFITHSLGSRIAIDAVQEGAEFTAAGEVPKAVASEFKDKQFTFYMMANQLPLLQLGLPAASVHGKIAEYCRPGGIRYQDRLVSQLNVYAFSDPNDILSYAIPPKFADEYLDSRLCPKITNITLNVARPVSVFGADLANPAEAHGAYDRDARVIGLMARGVGHGDEAAVVKEGCQWIETLAY